MSSERHIEELRDVLEKLRGDAVYLYRYGELGPCLSILDRLQEHDRRRLLGLALAANDPDLSNIALHLLAHLDPPVSGATELLMQLSEQDRSEIREQFQPGIERAMSPEEEQLLRQELMKAITSMSPLKLETANWIFLSRKGSTESVWLAGSGGTDGQVPAELCVENRLYYNPDSETCWKLFHMVRKSNWALHVHNHPNKAAYASGEDLVFARYWRAQRPELAAKMKFFVVAGACAVEYAYKGSGGRSAITIKVKMS
jgi:hypothetical protein